MPMYNLLEYSDIHFMTSESLRNYYRDELNDNANASQTTAATFQINKAKLYVPVVTLSVHNSIKFLENIK